MALQVKWWTQPQNFGDVLTPHLLDHFGIKYKYVDDVKYAEALFIGSIARLALPGQKVFGSGCIRKDEKAEPRAVWKFVRGPLTRENVLKHGGECPEIYGDAALLLPDFCPAPSFKKNQIGIVPHYQDWIFGSKYSTFTPINVVNENALAVAKKIASCEKIISSSLHGIIAAHAYGIPAAWVEFSKLHGDGIKFQDYFASVGIKNAPKSTPEKPIYIDPGKIDLDPIREIFHNESV